GVEREVLREALAACLVKDEGDRPIFDPLFEELFPAIAAAGGEEGRRKRRTKGPGGGAVPTGAGRGGGGAGGARGTAAPENRPAPGREAPGSGPMARRGPQRARPERPRPSERAGRMARIRELLVLPFREFTSRDVEEARDLVRELGARLRGRLARRERSARRGRLDGRRTLRAAPS